MRILKALLVPALAVILMGIAFGQQPATPPPDKSANIAERVEAPAPAALEWANLRLSAELKRTQAESLRKDAALLDQQARELAEAADKRLREMAEAALGDKASLYEPRVDQQGKLYFQFQKKPAPARP